jgi:uncharacterized membrane protein YfcA
VVFAYLHHGSHHSGRTNVSIAIAGIWELWWVFPAAVLFSFVGIGAGVSSALFFSPFFILIVGLSPAEAIGAGLLTEVFGMGNGLRAYLRAGLVDLRTARWLLAAAVPATAVGALMTHRLPTQTLLVGFGVGLIALGAFLLYSESPSTAAAGANAPPQGPDEDVTVLTTRDGETFRYAVCWRPPGVALAGVGGFITGLISAGLPEITTSQLILRCRIPPEVAIATSVFVLAIAAGAGAIVHAISATPAWDVLVWTVPGVLVGGTAGSHLGHLLPAARMESALGMVFGVVGAIVLVTTVG